ncbi:MAG: DUF7000 family protein [Verrucomicrobiales bacterium]
MERANLNSRVAAYKEQLDIGTIQTAYTELVKFVMSLKSHFARELQDQFAFGGIFQGYMDYTYFYFTNESLQKRKLKLGLVLNHPDMRFEIWLLGQTKKVQEQYWNLFRKTNWVQTDSIPRYSIFEHILIPHPDFDDLDYLRKSIQESLTKTSDRILASLHQIDPPQSG